MQQRLSLSKGKPRKEIKNRGKEVESGVRRGADMANSLWSVITVLIPLAQAINELLLLFTKMIYVHPTNEVVVGQLEQ